MTKIDVSFDSETWGTEPGCDIRSIGACVMDMLTGHVAGHSHDDGREGGTFYQAVANPTVPLDQFGFVTETAYRGNDGIHRKYLLHRDPNTVQWWSEQSAEAQAAFTDPMELRQGLILFGGWLRGLSGDTYDPADHARRFPDDRNLWCHGPAFDPPNIAAAYRACGLPVPWHYRAPRDTRTCFDMAGIDDHSAWLAAAPGPLGIPHHALDDAICQARAICAAHVRVRYNTDRRADAFYAGWQGAIDSVMPERIGDPFTSDQAYSQFIAGLS